jgi:RNA polymerase sigma factor (sigma-70 family)
MPPPNTEQARWFAEEVQPYEPRLRGYLRSCFPALRDVDDIVQESFLRIWRVRAAQPIRSARAFLFRIARNHALDLVRHKQALPLEPMGSLADLSVIEDRPDAAALLTREEKARLLGEALAALPDRCREIVFLHKIKGLSQRAVAQKFGLAEKTVANQIARGMKRCEQFFRQHGVEFF